MKTVDYINSLIKEKEELTALCKTHVETIRTMKRELTKLNSIIAKKDKKINKLENESINNKMQNELNKAQNELKNLDLKYYELKSNHEILNNKYNILKKRCEEVTNENLELKSIFDEIDTLYNFGDSD